MKIQFHLDWLKGDRLAFKHPSALSLLLEYTERIAKFTSCSVKGSLSPGVKGKVPTKIWICDRGAGSKICSSEFIASELNKLLGSGTQNLKILIGGPDGFGPQEKQEFAPDLLWSFGSLTLPHELAAVVAAEQIYRAWAQIRNLPYHKGH